MEDVLAVYTRPRDPDCPLVCLDETSKQLIAETRVPIAMKPGRPARFDFEYKRNGTANLFMMFAPLEGWRHVKVTDRHTAVDYAHVLKDLADVHFADARTIVLVQDNLNIHCKASLYEAFPAAEARRLVERFEWHYTPKHGSWLDLAESELGVLSSQCLARRIPDKQMLSEEIAAWEHDRNATHAKARRAGAEAAEGEAGVEREPRPSRGPRLVAATEMRQGRRPGGMYHGKVARVPFDHSMPMRSLIGQRPRRHSPAQRHPLSSVSQSEAAIGPQKEDAVSQGVAD